MKIYNIKYRSVTVISDFSWEYSYMISVISVKVYEISLSVEPLDLGKPFLIAHL